MSRLSYTPSPERNIIEQSVQGKENPAKKVVVNRKCCTEVKELRSEGGKQDSKSVQRSKLLIDTVSILHIFENASNSYDFARTVLFTPQLWISNIVSIFNYYIVEFPSFSMSLMRISFC